MPEQDPKERVLTGNTVAAQDKAKLAEIRANLVTLARVKKGLPQEPIGFDVEALSGLSNSTVIDEPAEVVESKVVPIDISKLSPNHSVVGFATLREKLDKVSERKAA